MAYDSNTIAALQSGALVLRDMIYITGLDGDGDPASWGFWAGIGGVTPNVISGTTGSTVSRAYVGDGSILKIPPIVDTLGTEAQSASYELNGSHTSVRDMVFGGKIRGGRIEHHRGIFSPATWALVAAPRVRFVGIVGAVDVEVGKPDSETRVTLSCVDDRDDLTKTNPALKSDESQQQLHDGDRFRRYDTAGQIEVRWGQANNRIGK